jgi:hypothetical protein
VRAITITVRDTPGLACAMPAHFLNGVAAIALIVSPPVAPVPIAIVLAAVLALVCASFGAARARQKGLR